MHMDNLLQKSVEDIVSSSSKELESWFLKWLNSLKERNIFSKDFWSNLTTLKKDIEDTSTTTYTPESAANASSKGSEEKLNDAKHAVLKAAGLEHYENLMHPDGFFSAWDLDLSDSFLDEFKSSEFEGCSLEAYPDGTINGKPNRSIGYGHSWATEGDVISDDQADQLLREDIAEFAGYVREYVTVPITQNMFDALFSFTYNAGPGRLQDLTTAYLNCNDHQWAMSYMRSINKRKPHGTDKLVINDGLVRRREKETELFWKWITQWNNQRLVA